MGPRLDRRPGFIGLRGRSKREAKTARLCGTLIYFLTQRSQTLLSTHEIPRSKRFWLSAGKVDSIFEWCVKKSEILQKEACK